MRRLLIMDDDDMVRDVAGRILVRLGYEVACARDGAEAIRVYTEARNAGKRFDLLIMDLTVPGGIGGEEALQRLREIDPGVKAIVSSGHPDDPVVAEYRKHGFVGAVSKPYSVKVLGDAVEKIFADSQ